MLSKISQYLEQNVSVAPLVTLRILFGSIMLFSLTRFIAMGWIEGLYVDVDYHFSFFEFNIYPGDTLIYLMFYLLIISCIFIIAGLLYKYAITIFFILFTYIELIDKSYYLNHYYFISVLSFAMIFLPLNYNYSIDSILNKSEINKIKNWQLLVPKVLISIVYLYAGIAKINSDWLLNAMPLSLWLPASSDLPVIGNLLQQQWVAYVFSWTGCIYDLTIWIFLFNNKTRKYAYIFVIFFHIMTSILFQIGIFPYMMTLLTLIFFSPETHNNIINKLKLILKYNIKNKEINHSIFPKYLFIIFILFQLIFPFRYILNKGDLFWTEEGYRFSWRVMLMEKTGWVNYKLIDKENNIVKNIDPTYYLSDIQVKQMSFQPDMILQYAKYLGDNYFKKYKIKPELYVDSYVSINGSGSRRYFKDNIDVYGNKYTDISEYLEEGK